MPEAIPTEDIKTAAQMLATARRVVALTGAGISKESGIPTFRDAQTGFWANYDPEKLATPQGFKNDPPLVWKWYDYRRKMVKDVKPNPGHFALAQMEAKKQRFHVVTQNIDGLHRAAGSKNVIELHGNICRHKCFGCGKPVADVPFDLEEPPKCACGSMLRPDVVWFGEALPEFEMKESFKLCESADAILVVGTSGLVQPAASLPLVARNHGAKLIEVNPDETPISQLADVFLAGPSGVVLPMLLEHI